MTGRLLNDQERQAKIKYVMTFRDLMLRDCGLKLIVLEKLGG